MPADLERFWTDPHARLGGIGDGSAKIVTIPITAAILVGPFLARPRNGKSVMGRHILLGRALFPLAISRRPPE